MWTGSGGDSANVTQGCQAVYCLDSECLIKLAPGLLLQVDSCQFNSTFHCRGLWFLGGSAAWSTAARYVVHVVGVGWLQNDGLVPLWSTVAFVVH